MVGLLKTAITAFVLAGMLTTPMPDPDVATQPYLEYVGDYRITAYNFFEGDGENYATAGGYEPVPYWTCAATYDFPMGTVLYIEDLGEVQVQDRGAFPDGIIDLHIGYDPIESFDDRVRQVYVVHY